MPHPQGGSRCDDKLFNRDLSWFHLARTCRADLPLTEVERMKWCAGDEINKAAVKDENVLNADD